MGRALKQIQTESSRLMEHATGGVVNPMPERKTIGEAQAEFEASPLEVERRETESRLARERSALEAQSALRQSRRRRTMGGNGDTLGGGRSALGA